MEGVSIFSAYAENVDGYLAMIGLFSLLALDVLNVHSGKYGAWSACLSFNIFH